MPEAPVTLSTRPLAERLWPAADGAGKALRAVALIAVGTLLLWVSAKVQIPFWPVPATLQTLVVVMIGAFYGSRLGLATVLAYLAEGAAGLPVFAGTPAKGIGLAYMMGPTGGFLVGFAVAAFLVGWLVERGYATTALRLGAAALIGHLVIYAFGTAWLSMFLGFDQALTLGVLRFLLADAVKVGLAAALGVAVLRTGR
jgi:biotin transport system substrate-specific component